VRWAGDWKEEAVNSEELKKLINYLDQAGYVLREYKKRFAVESGGYLFVIDEKRKPKEAD
jgi:hypothetical protein